MRIKACAALSALLLTAAVRVHAQGLPIKTYATSDGLAHNTVNRIVKDSHGFLWFCTAGGLSRFDGYGFTNFGTEQGLPHASVNDLLETRAGEYWVATGGGLVRFDPKGTPRFTVVGSPDGDRHAVAITRLIEGRDGTVWAGTSNGLQRLERTQGHQALRSIDVHMLNAFPEQRVVADLLEDARGSMWITTPSGLYRRWSDGSAARYTTRDGLPNEFLSGLLEDHEGYLWVGTRRGGFFRLSADGSHHAPTIDLKFDYQFRDPYGLPTTWISQLLETSDRRLWIATARGLVEFFPGADARHRFQAYAERNGLSDYNVTGLTEDLDGNLWLATTSSGAMKLTRGGLTMYGPRDGIETVNAIFADRAGTLCFKGAVLGDLRTSVFEGARLDLLTGDRYILYTRLGCFDGERFDWFKPEALAEFGWAGGWVQEEVTLQARTGEWWVGSGDGLYRFAKADRLAQLKTARPLAIYTTKDGLAAPQVFRLFEDSGGRIWVSTTSAQTLGLARWDPVDQRLHDMAGTPGLPSLKEELPRAFAEDRAGHIWIGLTTGLARFADGAFTVFTAADGLPTGRIMNLYVDHSGRLWFTSDTAGLVHVDHAGDARPTFVSYSTAQGLASNSTEAIVEDANGYLYVGGGNGLDRFDPATMRVKHFTTADGLPAGLFRAAFRDRTGVLWFGMTGGLARLVPMLERPAVPPPVVMIGVRVSGKPQPVSALGEREMSLPDIAPDQNQVQIDFVGLGFRSGDVLRYQYRLDGADPQWSAPGLQRTVTYASLAPGRYRFHVQAVNSEGVVSDHPASLGFTILHPFWLRWWFITLSALVVGLAIQTLYRYRVARLLEMANMRTRIATDLHDDIGANLTRIALLSEVAKQTPADGTSGDADGPLSSIARIARESVSSMSDIVWAINPKRESLIDLTRRMRQHAEEVFTLRGIEMHFTAPGAADTLKLGVDVRRDLLLIFKEAINNAVRHSRCSRVDIDLRLSGSRLSLEVADNGAGFDASIEREGQGLVSMRRRAGRLNGTLEISSGDSVGTRLTLNIPI